MYLVRNAYTKIALVSALLCQQNRFCNSTPAPKVRDPLMQIRKRRRAATPPVQMMPLKDAIDDFATKRRPRTKDGSVSQLLTKFLAHLLALH